MQNGLWKCKNWSCSSLIQFSCCCHIQIPRGVRFRWNDFPLLVTLILIMITLLLLCHWNTSLTTILTWITRLLLCHWITSLTMILIMTTLLLLGHWITSSTNADSCHWSRTQPANVWSGKCTELFLFSFLATAGEDQHHRPRKLP